MVLIVTEENDFSTNYVIDWLVYLSNERPLVINGCSKCEVHSFQPDKFVLKVDAVEINLDEIKSFWYRRGFIPLSKNVLSDNAMQGEEHFISSLQKHIDDELSSINAYLHKILETKAKKIGSISYRHINKILTLRHAAECGLLTPKTIITSYKKELLAEISRGEQVVTKAISNSFYTNGESALNSHTQLVDLDQLAEEFFPSLFQQRIAKEFDIRIFYLMGSFYSMAIFSDDQQDVDIRKVDKNKIREVPYKLPTEVEQKLDRLMRNLGLETGSIDMIKSTSGSYFFLEINPVGQFGNVSYFCNYYLEKKLAEELIK